MFLTKRFYILVLVVILLLGGGYLFGSLFIIGQLGLLALLLALAFDGYLLYRTKVIQAFRQCAGRFSNGDDNEVSLRIESRYSYPVRLIVIDEVPVIFQQRNVHFELSLLPNEGKTLTYRLRPTRRGEYGFGFIRVFTTTRIGLISRRATCGRPETVKVYPSYLMLHRYELLAMKASARRHQLMVNVYQDERSQQIYSVIDKGRVMQQAFRGMTLLDYAINASLVLSYVAMRKDDKAGLVTFNEYFDTFVPASKQVGQMQTLLENLYKQETTFGETDFSALCGHLGKHVNKRSFLVLYTNFSNMTSLNRQLVYLQQLARQHRVLVVFFEDADLKEYIAGKSVTTEDYYRHVIAEKFAFEKRLIVSTLKQHGIYSLLTTPDKLSIDVINKYLEMKSRQLL